MVITDAIVYNETIGGGGGSGKGAGGNASATE